MTIDDYPRIPLLFGPSPIHPLPRFSAALGGGVEIWAKREDCNSGIAYGGNKVRKLEYLVAEALQQGCDTLVSIGGVQSNHTRQVTGVAARLGLKAVTVQEHWVDWPDPAYERVGNIQLTRILGGDIRMDPAGFDIGLRNSWRQALDSVEAAGGRPYPIPAGASDHPLGGLGFASWAREVAQQEAQLGVFFDTVIVCSVTGSTQAGMVAGFALEGREDRRVIGIDGSATLARTREQIRRIARDTADRIGLGRELRDEETILLGGFEGPAYGIPDEGTVEAIHLAARTEGMLTDPVYEGKSLAGLIGLVPIRGDPARLAGALRAPRRAARPAGLRGRAGPRVNRRSGGPRMDRRRRASMDRPSAGPNVPVGSWYGGTLPGASAHRPHWAGEEPCPRGWPPCVRRRQCRRAARAVGGPAAQHRPGWRLDDHEARH